LILLGIPPLGVYSQSHTAVVGLRTMQAGVRCDDDVMETDEV